MLMHCMSTNISKFDSINNTFCRKMAKASKGVKISIYSSNSFGRSKETVVLETSLSKVAELQSGKFKY